ncbi:type I secretion protein [Primorskyibacter flagellatus]|uniref:Type I secretion protein n=1 Tax=Primorskyibacter flagellatus TaxID=1387277 RepID=A0A917A8J5_9RHOB|nr:Hint domain-containing protein [Primorskyibacter flagellatus]GGE35047.1 type I secretion protein [Primorskyibacter flagellatus]
MPSTTINAFYGGFQSDYDPFESSLSQTAENASAAVGLVLGSPAAPLWDNAISLTLNDSNSDGAVDSNRLFSSGETITYAGTSQQLDTALTYTAEFTYHDSTTATGDVVLLQDTAGRVFVTPWNEGAAENDVFTAKAIESIELTAVAGDTYTGVTSNLAMIDFTCFAGGTRILTPAGPMAAARLKAGDLVVTRDHGAQPLVWIGAQVVPAAQMTGAKRPVRLAKGAFGRGRPGRALMLSAQHRVLLSSNLVEQATGRHTALVAARNLLEMPGIRRRAPPERVKWVHLLFDRHEVIWAEGLAVESLFLGPQARRALGPRALADIAALPRRPDGMARAGVPAHPIPPGRQARDLVALHRRADEPLCPEAPPLQVMRRRPIPPVRRVTI